MKISCYTKFFERKNFFVIYNTSSVQYLVYKTKGSIAKAKELLQKQTFDQKNYMVKKWIKSGILVENDCNEFSNAKKNVDAYYKTAEKTLTLLIYVTEDCNFRCIYCPEDHVKNKLSDGHWNALYKYIRRNVKNGIYDTVALSFFGGEPLIEAKTIIKFLRKLNNLKKINPSLKFYHHVTTNGYLLTPRVYNALASLGVVAFQITIDGFADSHDKTRPRINNTKSWDVIIKNIAYINKKYDKCQYVCIRSNISRYNLDTLADFYEWFDKKFLNRKFSYNAVPVTKLSNIVDDDYVVDKHTDEIKKVYKRISALKRGVTYDGCKFMPLCLTCQIGRKNSFGLSANGELIKCEQVFAKSFVNKIGYLDTKTNDFIFTIPESIWNGNYEIEDCKTCWIYPFCAGRRCPSKKGADPVARTDCALAKEYAQDEIELYLENIILNKNKK